MPSDTHTITNAVAKLAELGSRCWSVQDNVKQEVKASGQHIAARTWSRNLRGMALHIIWSF
jgi:hypothetical protein